MSQKPANIADCLRVFCDAIRQREYVRDQDAEISEVLFRNPEAIEFLKNLRTVKYEEMTNSNDESFHGRWTCIFDTSEIASWYLRQDLGSKRIELQIDNSMANPHWNYHLDRLYDKFEFDTKEEMFEYVCELLKKIGYYFSRETWK